MLLLSDVICGGPDVNDTEPEIDPELAMEDAGEGVPDVDNPPAPGRPVSETVTVVVINVLVITVVGPPFR